MISHMLESGLTFPFSQTRDIFSYKHFYVIYCRFWELDTDHDMVISGKELLRYDVGRMTRRTVRRVSEALGRFTKPVESDGTKTKMEEVRSTERNWFRSLPADLDPEEAWQDAKLEYRDFVCALSFEVAFVGKV